MVYATDGQRPWSRTHAQAPSAIDINGRIRVYFGTRDGENRSLTTFVEFDREDPTQLLYIHDQPVMGLGQPGAHDEDGVIASHVIQRGDQVLMYYGGVSCGGSVPYRMSIGLACSLDGGLNFSRVFEGPIVDRTPNEPYMTMAPNVLATDQGWVMWYGSGIKWVQVEGKFEPIYVIKTAFSDDGLVWKQPNHTCIPQSHSLEANTRPAVLKTADGYEMWFCYRASRDYRDGDGSYRLGYATSVDGLDWTRQEDPEGLQPSGQGWNSATMSYPSVLQVDGRTIMFHNANGFGQSGIGCAIRSGPIGVGL